MFSFELIALSFSWRSLFSLIRRAIISESLLDGFVGCVCWSLLREKGIRIIGGGGEACKWHGCCCGDAVSFDWTECCGEIIAWFLDAVQGGCTLPGVCFRSGFFFCCLVAVFNAGSFVFPVQQIIWIKRLHYAAYAHLLPFPSERRPVIAEAALRFSELMFVSPDEDSSTD